MTIALPTHKHRARVVRIGKFGAVGGLGLVINLVAQALLIELVGLNYVVAAVLATQVSSTANFLIADSWVFDSSTARTIKRTRFLAFVGMNNLALILRAPMMWVLTSAAGFHYALSNLASLLVMTLVRFGIADSVIWKAHGGAPGVEVDPEPADPGPDMDDAEADVEQSTEVDEPDGLAMTGSDVRPKSLPRSRLKYGLALVGIVAFGAFLRLWKLGAVGFNSDEAVYAGQAAAIAGDTEISKFFPIFRAHPMLFQAMLSVAYQFGTSVMIGRIASVLFGLATVVVVFVLGRLMYGARAGLIAALILAVMPYHVIVTRQVLLDGPMTFFATLTLYLLAKYTVTRAPVWLYATAGATGLTVLAKETYVVLLGSIFMFLALHPDVRIRLREAAFALGVFVAVLLPYPITIVMAGKSSTGKSYLSWQLFRRPNHTLGFYPAVVPQYVGPLVLVAACVAVGLAWGRKRTYRERLLLSWFAVPTIFLEIWPVKGFHYLLAASVPLTVLAGAAISQLFIRRPGVSGRGRAFVHGLAPAAAVVVVTLSLAIPSWSDVQPQTTESFLAGTGGVPGGREAGEWIRDHTPVGAEMMTVGPSMANILQFYGNRKAYGLSVSPNPLNRNPSYEPIANADVAIRTNNLQYVVWDSYSTKRSSFFGDKVISYAERYHGRVVYTYRSGGKPVIVIYEVRP